MKNLTKSDIGLIIFLIIIAISINFILADIFKTEDIDKGKAVVVVDNKYVNEYDLSKDGEYTIEYNNNSNTIEVKDGIVKMTHATCSDGLCLYQPAISHGNEMIVCLPNLVIVTLENVENSEIDVIVQ